MPAHRRGARGRRLALVLLAGLVAGVGTPPVARAHAIVLESTPAPEARLPASPPRVELRFNSRIEKRLSRVTLGRAGAAPSLVPVAVDGDGGPPDRLVVPLEPLAPGRYVLRYRVMAADGHITEGSLRFTVDP